MLPVSFAPLCAAASKAADAAAIWNATAAVADAAAVFAAGFVVAGVRCTSSHGRIPPTPFA